MTETSSRAILEFAQRLLTQAEVQPDECLAELAKIFQVDSAGLVGVIDNNPIFHFGCVCSSDPNVLKGILSTDQAVVGQAAKGRRFIAVASPLPSGAAWILWLEDENLTSMPADEVAALKLVAALLGKQAAALPQCSHWAELLTLCQCRKRLEDASLVAGRVAHDFNNILAGILGFTELSLGQLPSGTPVRRLVREVYDAAQHGIRLVNQLESFGRRGRLTSQPFRIEDSVASVTARLQKQGVNGLNVVAHMADDLPRVAVDGETLLLILDPIIDNALEAMTPPGKLMISAQVRNLRAPECLRLLGACLPGPYVEVQVSDTGCGFTKEARERVLNQPFFTTKLRHRGLGLASVYGLLAAVRGGLRIDHCDVGTTVSVVLPVSATRAGMMTPPPPTPRNVFQRGSTEKVLVVDDDPMTLSFMCTTLEQAGFEVQSAADGLAALDSFDTAKEPFRLVLSDVRMPRMTGFELAERLLNRNPSLPILFTSGNVPLDCVPASFRGRTYDLLAKPFKPESLVSAVRTALSRKNTKVMSGRS